MKSNSGNIYCYGCYTVYRAAGSITAICIVVRATTDDETATAVTNTFYYNITTNQLLLKHTTYPTGATLDCLSASRTHTCNHVRQELHSTAPVHSRTPYAIARMLTTSPRLLPRWQATITNTSCIDEGQLPTALFPQSIN